MDNNTTQVLIDMAQNVSAIAASVDDLVRYQVDIWVFLVLLVIVVWVYILIRITWAGKGRR